MLKQYSGQPGHPLFVIGSNQDKMSGMTWFYTFHHHFNSLLKEIFHEKLDFIQGWKGKWIIIQYTKSILLSSNMRNGGTLRCGKF